MRPRSCSGDEPRGTLFGENDLSTLLLIREGVCAIRSRSCRQSSDPRIEFLLRESSSAAQRNHGCACTPSYCFNRSFGMWKNDSVAVPESNARPLPGQPVRRFNSCATRWDRYSWGGRGSDSGADAVWHGFSKAESVSQEHLRKCGVRVAASGGESAEGIGREGGESVAGGGSLG